MPAEHADPIPIPVDEDVAVYANRFEVWLSEHDIALDLYAVGPPEDGERVATPVARVRLPPTMVFPMIRTLSGTLDAFLEEGPS